MRSEVLAVALLMNQVSWDVTLCHRVNCGTQHFENCDAFQFQAQAVPEVQLQAVQLFFDHLILKLEHYNPIQCWELHTYCHSVASQ